ncbi:polysaccharide deacetylase family protein [Paraburkholderia sp. MMS20-SJTR3]|uniref:Polysaccharide deacetylase family protein n=1 Tax=Paraburkholderia sejongensis TaxID=2886946 RepID=A0ABS8JQ59_9BURK|nr:polysaccharide deacetylase family protein [Paraburkholderia sp. MMS20-SJTR3]MCC8391858.1 polysaccharide deacetylase family protein [Paraburkholderia sp. MMS20-SJTR3]
MKRFKGLVKELLAALVVGSGLAWLTRVALWRDRVAVLLYHDPDPATLDRHLTYLKTLCELVPLTDVSAPSRGRRRAAITLDDGHAGNAALLPVFIKHNVRPTIFLCSRIVGRNRSHWWLHPGSLRAGHEQLKQMTNQQRLAALAAQGYQQDGDDRATGLSLEQMQAMRAHVDFQAHTRFHPILTKCSDAESATEIIESRHEIEAMLQQPCEHFAYPNGNYGEREVELVRRAGFTSARTCDIGWCDQRSDPLRLPTIIIDDRASTLRFAAQLSGVALFLRYLKAGGGWRGRFPQF